MKFYKDLCYTQVMATKRIRAGNGLNEILHRIRQSREAIGLSQEAVGEKLGMSRAGYGHLESGTNLIMLTDLFKIARILNRPVEYLLGLDSDLTEDEGRILTMYRQARARGLGGLAMRQLAALVAEDQPPRL